MTESVTISPQRSIGNLDIDCTIEEAGTDNYTATRHPVEQGASITDHVYREPAQLSMEIGFSNSSAQADGSETYVVDTYNDLLAMQADRSLLDVVTGKRTYKNMIITGLSQTTTQETETTLICRVQLTELIIVSTQVTTVPSADKQANPEQTAAIEERGTVQTVDAVPNLDVVASQIIKASDLVKEVPLIPSPQRFGVALGEVATKMTAVWRDVQSSALGDLKSVVGGGWMLDIADQTGNAIASGLPLVTGSDLLGQLEYLGLDAKLLVQTSHDTDEVPTYDNLGILSHLYAALPGG